MTPIESFGPQLMRALLGKHGVTLRKSLGQNFVVDPNTIRKVVRIAGVGPEDHVLEIGAGAGALTVALARAARRVTALEIDARLEPVLLEVLDGIDNVAVVTADALAFDLASLGATRVVANLPYNIAATLVLEILKTAPAIADLTVMTQREVGERLAAGPGDDSYGATSVLCALWGDARVAARVSRRAFWPVPNVDSVVVRIVRRDRPEDVDPDRFYRIVKAAFSQRRKTLRNALARVSTGRPEELLAAAGVDAAARAEEIGLDGFLALARASAHEDADS